MSLPIRREVLTVPGRREGGTPPLCSALFPLRRCQGGGVYCGIQWYTVV